MLLSPCRHHQWEILLPPAVHQPPLLLRSIFKQRQNSRATSVCRAWQVRAGPQRGMDQLSFGGISGESMDHGLSGPEFEKKAPKIVLELCSGFHNSKLQAGERGWVYALWVLTGEVTFLKCGEFVVGSKFHLTVCNSINVLTRVIPKEDLCDC